MFAIWFGSNIMILTIATGALAPTIYHLSLLPALLAIVLGNVVGGVFMALHAAQGAELGVPQMVQTRGQFGTYGAVVVIALVVVMYIGFVASNFVLGGDSLHVLHGGMSARTYSLIICLVSLAAAIYGHDLIHNTGTLISWIAGVALLVCFVRIFAHGTPAVLLDRGIFTMDGFLGAVSTGAIWQISYAPYVSDYSRYLPPGVGARQAFWSSYAGCVLGSIIPMALGALVVIMAGGSDVTVAFARILGPVALFVVPVFSFGIVVGSAMNIYCGVLSGLTLVQSFVPAWHARTSHRVLASCALAGLSLVIAMFAASNFMEVYTSFILLLLVALVPWTAINLVDFYLIRHGEYDVAAFFLRDGGRYGRYNVPALLCYALGILVQIPFVANPLYTGPIARRLGGADISWIVGLAVIGPLYWQIMRRRADAPMAEASQVA